MGLSVEVGLGGIWATAGLSVVVGILGSNWRIRSNGASSLFAGFGG